MSQPDWSIMSSITRAGLLVSSLTHARLLVSSLTRALMRDWFLHDTSNPTRVSDDISGPIRL